MVWRNVLKNLKIKDKVQIDGTATLNGDLTGQYENHTGTGTATIRTGLLTMTGSGTAIQVTLLAPSAAGQRLEVIDTSLGGTSDHVLKAATGTYFSANSTGTGNTYTFNAPSEKLVLVSSSTSVWQVVDNTGSITLS